MPNRFGQGGQATRPVAPMGGGALPGGGQKTTYLEATEASERLMGFLVITDTKEDEEHRYFRLRKGVNFVGRLGSRCSIEIRDQEISSQHVLLVCTNSATRAIDLDSRNGMILEGQKYEIVELGEGDELKLGRTTLKYVPFPWVAED
jgi:pSer/pThr/pTyr-binding forkhead associated (FHA) protein